MEGDIQPYKYRIKKETREIRSEIDLDKKQFIQLYKNHQMYIKFTELSKKELEKFNTGFSTFLERHPFDTPDLNTKSLLSTYCNSIKIVASNTTDSVKFLLTEAFPPKANKRNPAKPRKHLLLCVEPEDFSF